MSYEKLKDENYNNLKGLSPKTSNYASEPGELLEIYNYTFIRPGALTSRPGVEKYYSLAISTYTLPPTSNFEYIKNSGASFKMYDAGDTLYYQTNVAIDSHLINNTISNLTTIPGASGLQLDFVIQNNYLYYANGFAFRRFDGTYAIEWNVSNHPFDHLNANVTFNVSLIPVNGVTAVIQSGTHRFGLGGYRNNVSLASVIMGSDYNIQADPSSGFYTSKSLGSTVVSKGRWLMWGFNSNFGFTYYPQYGISTGILNYMGPSAAIAQNGVITPQGSTALTFGVTTFGGVTQSFVEWDHFTLGIGYEVQPALNIYPKYIETYNNMLFMGNLRGASVAGLAGGITSQPSSVYFSNVGYPEQVDPENFVQVRTGNGEEITGMSVYQDSLIIFKNSTTHELEGSSPDTLNLRDLNLEYGCVSSRGIVTFENLLWFIDQKGIVQYDGANFNLVSYPIEPLFAGIDKSKMTAIHVKSQNQVWFCASNTVFAWDYVVKAWSIFNRLDIDADSGVQLLSYGATVSEVTYWQTGASFHEGVKFNMSLFTDFGQGITLQFKTRYHKRLGDSTQELWRRLFLNTSAPNVTATINFQPDYGSSIYSTRYMYLDQFQERIDFGISAKSLAVQVILQASQPVRVNGYTIESRYLRSV